MKAAQWVTCNDGKDISTSFDEDVFDEFCKNTSKHNEKSNGNDNAADSQMKVGSANDDAKAVGTMDEEMQVCNMRNF